MSNIENQIHHYAFAIYSLYEEKDQSFLHDLNAIFASLYQQKEIIEILSSNNISKQERKKIVTNIFNNDIDKYLINFLYVLIDNNFFHNVLFIIQDFFSYYNLEKNIAFLKIITPFPLDELTIKKIINSYNIKLNKEIVYTVEIDTSLIAGFKIIYNNDNIFDYSVKGKLDDLKYQIKNSKGE